MYIIHESKNSRDEIGDRSSTTRMQCSSLPKICHALKYETLSERNPRDATSTTCQSCVSCSNSLQNQINHHSRYSNQKYCILKFQSTYNLQEIENNLKPYKSYPFSIEILIAITIDNNLITYYTSLFYCGLFCFKKKKHYPIPT